MTNEEPRIVYVVMGDCGDRYVSEPYFAGVYRTREAAELALVHLEDRMPGKIIEEPLGD